MTQQYARHAVISPATIHAIECTRQVILAEKRLAEATRRLNNALVRVPDIDTPELFLAAEAMKVS